MRFVSIFLVALCAIAACNAAPTNLEPEEQLLLTDFPNGRDVGAVEINKTKTEGRIAQDIPGSVLLLEKLQPIVNNVVMNHYILHMVGNRLRLDIYPENTQPSIPVTKTTFKPTPKPTFRPVQELDTSELEDECNGGSVTFVKEKMEEFGVDAIVKATFAPDDLTCLYLAAWGNHSALVSFLIDAGADVNARCGEGKTPLHVAVWESLVIMATTLIDAGANINARDVYGRTPLHYAAAGNKVVIMVMTLIDAGADVDSKTTDGETPLRMAILDKSKASIVVLLKNGASLKAAKQSTSRQPLFDKAMKNPDVQAAIAEGTRLAGEI